MSLSVPYFIPPESVCLYSFLTIKIHSFTLFVLTLCFNAGILSSLQSTQICWQYAQLPTGLPCSLEPAEGTSTFHLMYYDLLRGKVVLFWSDVASSALWARCFKYFSSSVKQYINWALSSLPQYIIWNLCFSLNHKKDKQQIKPPDIKPGWFLSGIHDRGGFLET